MQMFFTEILVKIYKIIDRRAKYIRILSPPKRLFIYSGRVHTYVESCFKVLYCSTDVLFEYLALTLLAM